MNNGHASDKEKSGRKRYGFSGETSDAQASRKIMLKLQSLFEAIQDIFGMHEKYQNVIEKKDDDISRPVSQKRQELLSRQLAAQADRAVCNCALHLKTGLSKNDSYYFNLRHGHLFLFRKFRGSPAWHIKTPSRGGIHAMKNISKLLTIAYKNKKRLKTGCKMQSSAQTIATAILTVLLFGFNQASAQDFEKGLQAARTKDYATAIQEWMPLAKEGDPIVQHNVGILYERGYGVPRDYAQAVKWYTRSAEQGNAYSQYNLAVLSYEGKGSPPDYDRALWWYLMAAEQGHSNAQNNLGKMYYDGAGVAKDYAEAMKWYRLSASQGNAGAQYNIGLMYDKGKGVAQDYEEALKWYKLAAEQGNTYAQNNLGRMYKRGQGVEKDLIEALKWLNKSNP